MTKDEASDENSVRGEIDEDHPLYETFSNHPGWFDKQAPQARGYAASTVFREQRQFDLDTWAELGGQDLPVEEVEVWEEEWEEEEINIWDIAGVVLERIATPVWELIAIGMKWLFG